MNLLENVTADGESAAVYCSGNIVWGVPGAVGSTATDFGGGTVTLFSGPSPDKTKGGPFTDADGNHSLDAAAFRSTYHPGAYFWTVVADSTDPDIPRVELSADILQA